MFECKSRASLRMMAIPMFDQTELLPNGNNSHGEDEDDVKQEHLGCIFAPTCLKFKTK